MTSESDEKPGTVSVRIAAVICECGAWTACNTHERAEEVFHGNHECRCSYTLTHTPRLQRYWITAHVARPEPERPVEIEGEVSQ